MTGDKRLAIPRADVVILAIKPQNLTEVMTELNGRLRPTQLVLSIIAGARLSTLSQGLSHRYIVRAMPNSPAQIGEGITVWTTTAEITDHQKEWAKSILEAMGKEIHVDSEHYLDMATAISGSGTAYLFYFVEALVDAAVNIGLPRNIAQQLILETILGSAHLIKKSGKPPAELRRMVTSPGGTTAEAIGKLDDGDFTNLIKQAVSAAYDKARNLGNQQC